MREIKFRAWDLADEEYISWHQLTHTRYNQDYLREHGDPCGPFLSFMTDKHIQLEQYTGLKDKNGREIYEGDILKFDLQDYNGGDHFYVCAVEFGGAEFGCKHEDDDYWYWNSLNDITENDDEMEVLGNIHENPEILK